MQKYFNPRPPCGGRHIYFHLKYLEEQFQSTSSVWRTTSQSRADHSKRAISIHVLRVEDDVMCRNLFGLLQIFQSTSSVWRTTGAVPPAPSPARISIHVLRVEDDDCVAQQEGTGGISIHVLRVEDDAAFQVIARRDFDFNPRPPCGGRLAVKHPRVKDVLFQSTSSVWRTTCQQSKSTGRL